jgi:hypothetical protein
MAILYLQLLGMTPDSITEHNRRAPIERERNIAPYGGLGRGIRHLQVCADFYIQLRMQCSVSWARPS